MLKVLLFSLLTTSFAFTTHRYDAFDSFGNYRPSAAVLDKIFGYENSNGRRPVQVYDYTERYDGVLISDVDQSPVVNSDGDRRRVDDMPYSYLNPYQWNRVVVTEPAKFYNRFETSHQDSYNYNPNMRNKSPVVQQDKEENINQRERTNELNKTHGNVSVPQISRQLDDVNRTLAINEQQITWNNDHESSSENNGNITTRSINSDDHTNSLNAPTKQNANKFDGPAKTNNRTAHNNNLPNNTANASSKSSTKTTQDNEVTPRAHEQRTKPYDDNRWIWSNAEDQVVTTTIQTDLGDRAAFTADGCPVGMAKVGETCVVID